MVLLHLMVVVIGVLRYVCVVQCLGSWAPSVALGILSDSTVTPSAVKISDLHIFKEMEIWCLEYPGLLCPTRALWKTHSTSCSVPATSIYISRDPTICILTFFLKNYFSLWIKLWKDTQKCQIELMLYILVPEKETSTSSFCNSLDNTLVWWCIGCISSSPTLMGSAELTMIWHISVPATFPLKRTSFTVKPLSKCAQCAHKWD